MIINANNITTQNKINKTNKCNFKGQTHNANNVVQPDNFTMSLDSIKQLMLNERDKYIKQNPDAFITLDHVKSNYDNHYLLNSVKNQTTKLDAVSTEDFCELSEIMKNIRLPKPITVYRAMSANDFGLIDVTPEEFVKKYYKKGKNITVPVYMHSSFDENIAYRFGKAENRFIMKLNLPKGHPAVYMEKLAPNDAKHYGNEEEVNIIRNSQIKLKDVKKVINPLNNKEIYIIEGDVTGFKDIKPEKKNTEFVFDDEMIELLNAIEKLQKS